MARLGVAAASAPPACARRRCYGVRHGLRRAAGASSSIFRTLPRRARILGPNQQRIPARPQQKSSLITSRERRSRATQLIARLPLLLVCVGLLCDANDDDGDAGIPIKESFCTQVCRARTSEASQPAACLSSLATLWRICRCRYVAIATRHRRRQPMARAARCCPPRPRRG